MAGFHVAPRSLASLARRSLVALVFPSLLLACSESGEPGACHREGENLCIEHARSQGAAGKRMCSAGKWIPGEKACPTERRLGTCLKEGGKLAEIVYSGTPNNFSASAAKNACEWKGGVFTSPNALPAATASASAKP